jgi:hypothetical protein
MSAGLSCIGYARNLQCACIRDAKKSVSCLLYVFILVQKGFETLEMMLEIGKELEHAESASP